MESVGGGEKRCVEVWGSVRESVGGGERDGGVGR